MKFPHGKTISSGILSKVRHALRISKQHPQNNTTCTEEYWRKVCETVGEKHGKTYMEIDGAIRDYGHYMSLRFTTNQISKRGSIDGAVNKKQS